MKERIVIEADEKICKGCDTCLQEPRIVAICNLKNNLDIDLKKEQVPETWEELKELCKDLESKKIITTSTGIRVEDDCIEFHGLQFLKSGIICHEAEIEAGFAIRLNRTPQQMWQIIKNLIGEE